MVDCVRGFRCCLFGRHFFGLFLFLRRRHFNCSPPHSPRFPVKHFDFCGKRRPYSFIFPKPTEAKKMHKIICMRSFEMRNSREMGGRRKWGKISEVWRGAFVTYPRVAFSSRFELINFRQNGKKMLGKRSFLIRRGVWDVSFEWRRRKTCGVILWEKERVQKIFGPPNPDPASQKTAAKNSCDFPNLLRSLFRALIQGLTELPSFSHAGLNNKGEIFIFYRRNQFSEKRKSFCVCEIAACVCLRLVSVCKWDHHRRSGGGGSGKFKIIRLISSLASFPFSV